MAFPDFSSVHLTVNGVRLFVRTGGAGPPLLLLHGFPESHRCWAAVAPDLAAHFTVVCPDLRNYGQSEKPPADGGETYAKRTMARDCLEMMRQLGHGRFAVAGHDRGAAVAYRLALDAPDAVSRLAVMSILPVPEQWRTLTGVAGLGAYQLYLLAQPAPFPERLIGNDPAFFLDHILDSWTAVPGAISPATRAAYHAAFRDPAMIHAVCEDYRANAGIDRETDEADEAAGARLAMPVLALWEQPEGAALPFDPLAIWGRWARDVRGEPITSGHFLPEEAPDAVTSALLQFLPTDAA